MPRRVSTAPVASPVSSAVRSPKPATAAAAPEPTKSTGWKPGAQTARRRDAARAHLPKLEAAPPPLREPTLQQRLSSMSEGTKRALTTLGLTPDDVKNAGEQAAPRLLLAAEAVALGLPDKAVEHLLAAGPSALPLVTKAAGGLAQKLPDGAAKTLLSNQNALTTFVQDKDLHAAVVGLFKPETRMAGARALLGHEVAREAVLSAIGSDPTFTKALDKVGLTPAALNEAGRAAAPLWDAAEAFKAGQVHDGLESLSDAVAAAPELAGRVVQLGLDRLPPAAKQSLDAMGLTAADLLQSAGAMPSLYDAAEAFKAGKVQGGLEALSAAITAAPQLSDRLVQLGLDRLPPAAKKQLEAMGLTSQDLLQSAGALPSLYAAAQALAAKDYGAAFSHLSEASGPAGPVAQKAIAALAGKLPDGPAKAVLTSPDVLASVVSDPSLHEAVGQLFSKDTRTEGVRALLSHDGSREAVLGALAGDPSVQAMLAKVGLTPAELPQLGRVAPAAWDLVEAVQAGDFESAAKRLVSLKDDAPDLAARLGRGLEKAMPAPMKKGLEQLGLGGQNLVEAGAALPALIGAAKLAGAGDVKGALASLGDAVLVAPDTVTKSIVALASKLPGDGLVKSMLTDPAIIGQLVSNRQLHGTVRGLLKGDVSALRQLSANAALGGPVAERLWANPATQARLSKLGFESARDVAEGFGGLAAAMNVVDQVKAEDYRGAIDGLGAVAAAMPDALRRKVTERLTQTMKLPPGLANVCIEGGLALTDPAVRQSLADATVKVKAGDVQGFLKSLASTGALLSKSHPAAAASFLDALQNLPGGMGRLFKDAELNRLLVSTGTVEQLFGAAQHLANGDPAAAAKEVGQAITGLVGAGPRYTIAGRELPVLGQDGAKAMTKLFERVVDSLPPQAKAKVMQKAAELAAKSGMSFVPIIGPAVGAYGEAKEIYDGMQRVPPDYISISVDGAQLVLQVASLFPPAQPFVQPINIGLGFLEVAADARLLIEDLSAFKREFTGLAGGATE